MAYEVLSVPEGAQDQLEPLGTKRKFWYMDANLGLSLFKYARPGTGEDWAEKIAAQLATELGLPHAQYELAECGGARGVVSPSFSPEGGRLIFGNELLKHAVSNYDTGDRYHRQHHTVNRVFGILAYDEIATPKDWVCPEEISSAAAVFLGYLLLDVLIGNQDRHDENWGLLLHEGTLYLQPTFDHASSLGRNESDRVRLDRLNTRDKNRTVARYIERARSALYITPSAETSLSTLDAFIAGARLHVKAAHFWRAQLALVSEDRMRQAVWDVDDDRMSDISKQFALRMLQLNKSRLLELAV